MWDSSDLWSLDLDTVEWAWEAGPAAPDQAGNWSAGGVGAQPGARYAGAAWTGGWKGGELWLFGGWGMDAVGDRGYLSDVWKYTVMAEN